MLSHTYVDAPVQLGEGDQGTSNRWVPHAMEVSRGHRHITAGLI